jgi:hypothetical protein
MAQWLGQFSGNTHATAVADAEELLRHAIDVLRATSAGPERARKAKAVRNLAKRVFSARERFLKARRVEVHRVRTEEAMARHAREIDSLQCREAQLRKDGIVGILHEFGALEVVPAGELGLP